MANEYEAVEFVVEDLGNSPLAERFGVEEYPAIFVDQALVARPRDFYTWDVPGSGKYAPWKEAENRRRFQRDLRQMLEMRVLGEDVPTLQAGGGTSIADLPDETLQTISGDEVRLTGRGKPLIVEFWASWCPPCLTTLEWMKDLDPKQVDIVTIAVESDRADVDRVLGEIGPPGRHTIGDPAVVEAFGGLAAVPAMFIADSEGKIVRTLYGAPPDLHARIEEELAQLTE